jgi:uncharacterized protein (DUF302 family)
MTRLSIDISDELHHYLKIHIAYTKSNIRDFVTKAIYMQVEQEKVPNEETIKALEESRQGIGVTSNSSVEEMMNEIYQELEEEGFKVKKHA